MRQNISRQIHLQFQDLETETTLMNQLVRQFIVLIGLLFVFGFTSPVEAQEWARKMLTEYAHDFGEVQKGEMPEYRFELKNVYEETINIAQVFSSCGCTQVSVAKRQLKTWESTEIVCRFNSKPFNGFKQATVTVRFGQPMVGEVQLTVKGTIVSAIRLSPESIDFGQVTRGKLPVYRTTLTGPPNANFKIVDIKSTFPHIGVALENPVRTQSNQIQYTLKTRLKDSAPEGFSQGDLFIVVQEGAQQRQLPLKFSARLGSSVKLSPSVLTMTNVKPGKQIKKKVVVRADEPFKITDVKCRTKAFRVSSRKPGMSKTHIVEVSYTPEVGKSDDHDCELTFFTSLSSDAAGKVKIIVEHAPDQASTETAPILISDG